MVVGYGHSLVKYDLEWLAHRNLHSVVELTIALLLVLPGAKAYGLCIGSIGKYWRRVLLFCAVPITLTWIAVSIMPANPFEGSSSGLWLISPLAQDLVFAGFLWPHFNRVFPGNLSSFVPIPKGVFLCATCFMLYHLVNFASMPAQFVCFQLFYTFVGGVWTGMTRFWTGSVIYMTITHMIVNFLATR
jgi:membrane protease YdiL (CAAX protease family)